MRRRRREEEVEEEKEEEEKEGGGGAKGGAGIGGGGGREGGRHRAWMTNTISRNMPNNLSPVKNESADLAYIYIVYRLRVIKIYVGSESSKRLDCSQFSHSDKAR